jgi:hypothetical protein
MENYLCLCYFRSPADGGRGTPPDTVNRSPANKKEAAGDGIDPKLPKRHDTSDTLLRCAALGPPLAVRAKTPMLLAKKSCTKIDFADLQALTDGLFLRDTSARGYHQIQPFGRISAPSLVSSFAEKKVLQPHRSLPGTTLLPTVAEDINILRNTLGTLQH